MDYLEIAVLIVVIVGTVHMVFKAGTKQGIEIGRMQILEENLKRTNADDSNLILNLKNLTEVL